MLPACDSMRWLLPVGVWLVAASVLAFLAYGFDKAAARQGKRRLPENRLHLISLAGGWPGALAAQVLLRHKSRKRPFQVMFRFTVAAHCVLLAILLYYLGLPACVLALLSAAEWSWPA